MYQLVKFGDFSIDYANAVDNVGSGETPVSYQGLPGGGALDNFGGAQKAPSTVERTKQMSLTAGTPAAVEALYLQLLALRGKRDKLYRRMLVSGALHWQYARLAAITAQRTFNRSRRAQPVELKFLCQEAVWHGDHRDGWYLDSGVNLDAGSVLDANTHLLPSSTGSTATGSFTINLGAAVDPGRAPVRSMQIVIRGGLDSSDALLKMVEISNVNSKLTWSRSGLTGIGNTTRLVIDTGIMQARIYQPPTPPQDVYDEIEFMTTADMASWFSLSPGPNEIFVKVQGGGTRSTIEFIFDEAWY